MKRSLLQKTFSILFAGMLLLASHANPQLINCIDLKPGAAAGKDANIFSGYPTSNLEPSQEFISIAWTCQGNPCTDRALIEFNLSFLPQFTTITNATLDLFANPTPVTMPTAMYGTANASFLSRITSSWNENIVTWSTQPTITSFNQVTLPQSTSTFQDYLNIDVTDLVQDIINDPANSFGFMLRLQNETFYNGMTFCSSDYPDTTLHPHLRVCYVSPVSVSENNFSENNLQIYPNPSSGNFSITFPFIIEKGILEITDLTGRIILEENIFNSSRKEIFLKSNEAGMYLLKIISGKSIFAARLILIP